MAEYDTMMAPEAVLPWVTAELRDPKSWMGCEQGWWLLKGTAHTLVLFSLHLPLSKVHLVDFLSDFILNYYLPAGFSSCYENYSYIFLRIILYCSCSTFFLHHSSQPHCSDSCNHFTWVLSSPYSPNLNLFVKSQFFCKIKTQIIKIELLQINLERMSEFSSSDVHKLNIFLPYCSSHSHRFHCCTKKTERQ